MGIVRISLTLNRNIISSNVSYAHKVSVSETATYVNIYVYNIEV
jgi:hypothetical protein